MISHSQGVHVNTPESSITIDSDNRHQAYIIFLLVFFLYFLLILVLSLLLRVLKIL